MRRLKRWHWHYVLRQKATNQIQVAGQGWQNFGDLLSQPGQSLWLGRGRLTLKHVYATNLLAHWQVGEEEPWLLATDLPDRPATLQAYARRMWIEEMLGDLKSKGFDLESTHLHTCARLSRLTLAVALLYTWLTGIGGKIIKNGLRCWVDRAERRDLSIFQIGLRSVNSPLTDGLPIKFDCSIGCLGKLSGSKFPLQKPSPNLSSLSTRHYGSLASVCSISAREQGSSRELDDSSGHSSRVTARIIGSCDL